MTAFAKGCTLLWDTLIPVGKPFDEDFVIFGVDKTVFTDMHLGKWTKKELNPEVKFL